MSVRAYTRTATRSRKSTSTPQTQPLAGVAQVQNNAGGYVFSLDKFDALTRFLILGSEGGTYYVTEQDLTKQNHIAIQACLNEDWKRTIDLIVSVSVAGRAPKNDPAIFALAVASAHSDVAARTYALSKLSDVCRIPTHLFHFMQFVTGLRGTGRALRRAVADWYTKFDAGKLAYEVVKYQSRDGWSNADVLRLAHPVAKSPEQDAIFRWVLGVSPDARTITRNTVTSEYPALTTDVPALLQAFDSLKGETDTKKIVKTIQTYKLTREMVPTEALKHREVWEALLPSMPLTALARNLGNMSKVDLLKPLSDATRDVTTRLRDPKYITDSRLHPLSILTALLTYQSGRGVRGGNTWTVVPAIVDALDDAFYLSFGNITPTNKRLLFGCDVSGSMSCAINGGPLTCRDAVAALAMVSARTEQEYYIFGFTNTFADLKITAKMSLADAQKAVYRNNFGTTDCAVPMVWAKKNKIKADAFIVLTDSETYAGTIHPQEALKQYRSWSGLPAKQIVVGMTATNFTIADPNDPLTLDVVGFDTAAPAVMSEFIRG